jgi:hypothetical protein
MHPQHLAATVLKALKERNGFDRWLRIVGPTPVCCAARAKWDLGPMARALISAMHTFGDPVIALYPRDQMRGCAAHSYQEK